MLWFTFDDSHDEIASELDDITQSDRSVGIIAATFLESRLELALKSRLTDRPRLPRTKKRKSGEEEKQHTSLFNILFDNYDSSPLGTFSAKIKMGLAIGLFGLKTYSDLEIIREIRNIFAHQKDKRTFHTPQIRDLCELLWLPKNVMQSKNQEPPSEPRRQYLHAVNMINGGLYCEMTTQEPPKENPMIVLIWN